MNYWRVVGLLFLLAGFGTANAGLITTSASGNLMFECLGGETGRRSKSSDWEHPRSTS